MRVEDIFQQARDSMTVRRVFGEPIEREDVVVVPVARVRGGGGGGGSGRGHEGRGEETSQGWGGGWAGVAEPAGVYVIRKSDGAVSWQPAVDVNRIAMGGQMVVVAALLLTWSLLRRRRRRGAGPRLR
jgi:uncharacterized spore protein YtfJ